MNKQYEKNDYVRFLSLNTESEYIFLLVFAEEVSFLWYYRMNNAITLFPDHDIANLDICLDLLQHTHIQK